MVVLMIVVMAVMVVGDENIKFVMEILNLFVSILWGEGRSTEKIIVS